MSILMHVPVAGAYFGLAWWAWRDASAQPAAELRDGPTGGRSGTGVPPIERWLLLLAWLAHGALLAHAIFQPEGLQFGFALALSSTLWLAVAVYWIESLYFGLVSMRLLVLPLSGSPACAALPCPVMPRSICIFCWRWPRMAC